MTEGYTGSEQGGRAPGVQQRCNGPLIMGLTIIIALIAAIGFFLYKQQERQQRQADAMVNAAESVSDTARDVSQAISDATRRIRPKD